MGLLSLLKKQEEFSAFRNSRSYQGSTLKIRVLQPLHQNVPRFGFIVPKKVLPKVTDRNVVKRRLKSILVASAGKLKPVSVLFFPSSKALKQTFANLEKETKQLFTRANLWKS